MPAPHTRGFARSNGGSNPAPPRGCRRRRNTSPTRARSARGRRAVRAPGSTCRAPSPTSTRDTPCSTQPASYLPQCSRASLRLSRRFLARQVRPRERAGPVRIAALVVAVRELRERALSLDVADVAEPALLVHELVQLARLADVRRDVRRELEAGLLMLREVDRELHLLDARVDALRAALVAEEAARALPDAVLAAVLLEPLNLRRVARVADEAHPLRERLRAEELRVGLHRVALRDTAAAVDAERFLVDGIHPLL